MASYKCFKKSYFKLLTEVTEEESDRDGGSEDSQVNKLIRRHGSGNTETQSQLHAFHGENNTEKFQTDSDRQSIFISQHNANHLNILQQIQVGKANICSCLGFSKIN